MSDKKNLTDDNLKNVSGGDGWQTTTTTCPICNQFVKQTTIGTTWKTIIATNERRNVVKWQCESCNGYYYHDKYNDKTYFESDVK